MQTPWGKSQTVVQLAEGILRVSTSTHGGIKLDRKRNAKVPEYMRCARGWYEEDCEWSIVGMVFPEFFSIPDAIRTFRDWYPDLYERFTGCVLKEGESAKRDENVFYELNKNNLIVTSASSGTSWEPVPDGFVLTHACVGGYRGGLRPPERKFLVPKEEYAQRGRFGFVIDPQRHYKFVL